MASENERKITRTLQPDNLTNLTSDQGGTAFQAPAGEDVVVLINTDTADGTNPTLDISLQEFDPNGGEWVDTGDNVTQITSTGTSRLEAQQPLGSQLRLHYDVGGTSPDFDVHSTVYLIPKTK